MEVIGRPAGYRSPPGLDRPLPVVRMQAIHPGLSQAGQAGPIGPAPADAVDPTIRPCRPGYLRTELDCMFVVILALAQPVENLLAVGDVAKQNRHLAGGRLKDADIEPAILRRHIAAKPA